MKNKEHLFQYIEQHQDDILHFLSELIQFKAINPRIQPDGGEGEIQSWIADRFRDFHFDQVDIWAVDPQGNRPNVVGTIKGTKNLKSLIFNGHCDVVSVTESESELWSVDPWRAAIIDGNLYGRGSSDMLAGLTAMIWAGKALIDTGTKLSGNLYIESVAGEESQEGQTIGTAATIEKGYTSDFAVVGEPTNCEIVVKTPGVFHLEIVIKGKKAHISNRNQVRFPQRGGVPCGSAVGIDAISKAIPFLQFFQELEVQWNQRWQDELSAGDIRLQHHGGIGIYTINPCFIEGGSSFGSVPEYCRLYYAVFYPNWIEEEKAIREIKDKIHILCSLDDWLVKHPPEINIPSQYSWKPMREISPDHVGVRALARSHTEVFATDPVYSVFKGLTDATFLSQAGVPTVLFGPGSLDRGTHGPNEHVPIQQVIDATKTYAALALNYLSDPDT